MDTSNPDRAPIFIVGCMRSGTTLLQALIDNHPNIAIPPESHIYPRFGRIVHTYGDLAMRQNRFRLLNALLHDAFIQRWKLQTTPEEVDEHTRQPTFAGVIDGLFSVYAEKSGAIRWGDKTPAHIHHLAEIRRDFPQAKLIHLVRDGRDVAEAMRRMVWGPVSAVGLARQWRHEVLPWKDFSAIAGNADMLIVRYEDLVTSPPDTLRRIFEFLDEPCADTSGTYADSRLSMTVSAHGPWQGSLREGISAKKIGRYRKVFSEREIEIMEAIAGEALSLYGYEPGHRLPRGPGFADRLYARVADPAVRWYRKLYYPRAFWVVLQYKMRIAYRLVFRSSPQRTA